MLCCNVIQLFILNLSISIWTTTKKEVAPKLFGSTLVQRLTASSFSHAGVPGLSPADPIWVFETNIIVSPLPMCLGDHVNGGGIQLRLRPVYRR